MLAVVGPTAVGKTDLSMRLAELLEGEIVGADSRQVYRHMDVGTAKPSLEARARVPHHLVDVVDPDEQFGLANYLELAKQSITNTDIRGKIPILVGGTGQYIWALLEGWQVPEVPPDPDTRESLEALAKGSGVHAVLQVLEEVDPVAAATVDRGNLRRIIRAVEVARHGVRPDPAKVPPPYDPLVIGLGLARSLLYQRIDRRVDDMMNAGWLSEVGALLEMGYGPDLPSMSGVGYRELAGYIQGETSLDAAVQRTKFRSHRYARQQHAWFKRSDPRIRWFDAGDGVDTAVRTALQWLDRPRRVGAGVHGVSGRQG
jgi:tRNA dimethylallyltransferase